MKINFRKLQLLQKKSSGSMIIYRWQLSKSDGTFRIYSGNKGKIK